MGKSLGEIAEALKNTDKKVQLIYAFNGVGKTRLSMTFKNLISPHKEDDEGLKSKQILYYNAFTEDLFYWDNDLENDTSRKLIIQPNDFINWVFADQGKDQEIVKHFQNYTSDKITPIFNQEYKTSDKSEKEITIKEFSEVTFSYTGGNEDVFNDIKISKGEESCFIWSVFYTLFSQVIDVLNISDEEERETDRFNNLKYIFIDDPVSSLDENHLIELAVDLSEKIKKSDSSLKFIITTHNPLFYNVLYNELNSKKVYILQPMADKTFELKEVAGDSNKGISYHHFLISEIKQAIDNNKIEKYHFILLRNLYEKVASFLGYEKWSDLLPNDSRENYESRIMNFYSHQSLSNEEVKMLSEPEKQIVTFLFNNLIDNARFFKEN